MKDKIVSRLKQIWTWLEDKLNPVQKPPLDYASRSNVAIPNWPLIKLYLAKFKTPLVVIGTLLCLMLLFGCSTKRVAVQPPDHLTAPVSMPTPPAFGSPPEACVFYARELIATIGFCENQKRLTIEHYKDLD